MMSAVPMLSVVLLSITWHLLLQAALTVSKLTTGFTNGRQRWEDFAAGGMEKPEYISSLSELVCLSSHNKIPLTDQLKQQKVSVAQACLTS